MVKVSFMSGHLVTVADVEITAIAMAIPEAYTQFQSALHLNNNWLLGIQRNVHQHWLQHIQAEPIQIIKLYITLPYFLIYDTHIRVMKYLCF